MSNRQEQQRLAVHGRRLSSQCLVKPSQASEEFAVGDDTPIENGQFTYSREIESKLSENFGSEAESPIEIPTSPCRFAGMRLLAIDKKHLSGCRLMLRTPI